MFGMQKSFGTLNLTISELKHIGGVGEKLYS